MTWKSKDTAKKVWIFYVRLLCVCVGYLYFSDPGLFNKCLVRRYSSANTRVSLKILCQRPVWGERFYSRKMSRGEGRGRTKR